MSLTTSCLAASGTAPSPDSGGDLGLGDVEEGASDWSNATQCKPIPEVEPLADPSIVISLDGLTLHLVDKASGYDRVFPIGPGAIKNGESLTPTSDDASQGLFHTGANTEQVDDGEFGYYYACRIWWTDPDSGAEKPVFAGLPFIRLTGAPTLGYGIHGPIDDFSAPNGGDLRRGYVSHGCVRMAAEDIVEVYGRIKKHASTPVRIQQETELDGTGAGIDLPSRFIGGECTKDAECTFSGGVCRLGSGQTRGVCTRACTSTCPDKAGEATTFCVRDSATSSGICVPKASTTFNDGCARYEGRLTLASGVSRPDLSAKADVCMPPK